MIGEGGDDGDEEWGRMWKGRAAGAAATGAR
jgi:hypothetical protein